MLDGLVRLYTQNQGPDGLKMATHDNGIKEGGQSKAEKTNSQKTDVMLKSSNVKIGRSVIICAMQRPTSGISNNAEETMNESNLELLR